MTFRPTGPTLFAGAEGSRWLDDFCSKMLPYVNGDPLKKKCRSCRDSHLLKREQFIQFVLVGNSGMFL